jgi:prepilin-type N-terminal cleavage/methylation domain
LKKSINYYKIILGDKMKKGFTLIELLAVIFIITLIMGLIFPNVLKVIKNQKIKLRDDNIATFKQAANKYTVLNEEDFIGVTSYQISVSDLKKSGLIPNKSYMDPVTDEEMSGCVKLEYDDERQAYNYEYIKTCE